MIKPRRRKQLRKKVASKTVYSQLRALLYEHPELKSAPRRWERLLQYIGQTGDEDRNYLFYQAGELLSYDIGYLKDIVNELEIVESKYQQELNAAIRAEKKQRLGRTEY